MDWAEAVRRCFAAALSDRVAAYHAQHGGGAASMAVLVQVMVNPVAAGVAFTAHPVTGNRDQTVVTAVAGLGEPLVSGDITGEEWMITTESATMTRPGPSGGPVLSEAQAQAVAELARRVAGYYAGRPQDIEWAIDHDDTLWLLQARPMTAVPEAVSWTPPGPGLWMRNFRLGEWLPEAVTPLFSTWLLRVLEDGYLDGMQGSLGVRVPFRYALLNGWYYNAAPIPSPRLLARILWRGRRRAVKIGSAVTPPPPTRPSCPTSNSSGATHSIPAIGSSSPTPPPMPKQPHRHGLPSWSTLWAGKPGSTCGTWRSLVDRPGRWKPASPASPDSILPRRSLNKMVGRRSCCVGCPARSLWPCRTRYKASTGTTQSRENYPATNRCPLRSMAAIANSQNSAQPLNSAAVSCLRTARGYCPTSTGSLKSPSATPSSGRNRLATSPSDGRSYGPVLGASDST
jgi:hypothetical protein